MDTGSGAAYKAQAKPGQATVLAIDDVNLNLLMIKKTLADTVNLYTVKSGENAMKVLDMVQVDLLLLDLEMPEMNGIQFLQAIRGNPSYEKLPVIIVTSNAKRKALEETLKYGILDYVTKPFEPDILRKKVLKALETKETET